MKRLFPWMAMVILLLLAACSYARGGAPSNFVAATPTLSPDQVQTQINQLLTMMPTTTGQPQQQVTATAALPTVPPSASGIVTATPTTQPATAAPTSTSTSAPAPTATIAGSGGVGVPTPTVTATVTKSTGPTATPVPGDPRTRLGTPSGTDPMDNATHWVWPTGSDQFTSATFSNGKQFVTALTGTDGWRLANPIGSEFTNIYLEATTRTETCAGSDHYGLYFRVPAVHQPEQGYLFGVTCDGKFSLRKWDGTAGTKGVMTWLVDWTANNAIIAGKNQTNRLGVMMIGDRLLLYANGKLLKEVHDATYASGFFGVFVGSDVTDQLTIEIDEMSYWTNPTP